MLKMRHLVSAVPCVLPHAPPCPWTWKALPVDGGHRTRLVWFRDFVILIADSPSRGSQLGSRLEAVGSLSDAEEGMDSVVPTEPTLASLRCLLATSRTHYQRDESVLKPRPSFVVWRFQNRVPGDDRGSMGGLRGVLGAGGM